MSHNIEVSVELEIQANLAFWVDKDEWEGKTDDQKRQEILNEIALVNNYLNDDVIHFRSGANISAVILGPDGEKKPVDLEKVEIYDTEK